jgi:hypothetical protein
LAEYLLPGPRLAGVEERKFFFPSLDDLRVGLGDPADFIELVEELVLSFFAFRRFRRQNSSLQSSKICPNDTMSLWARQGSAGVDSFDLKSL